MSDAKQPAKKPSGTNRAEAGKRADVYRPNSPLPRGNERLQLHSMGTPNGQKVTIFLEELGLPYDAFLTHIMKGDQFKSGFVDVNPNSKIPALVDTGAPSADGKTEDRHVFESTSILVYLAENFDTEGKYYPKDHKLRTELFNWLFFQHGAAPYFGQFGHFYKYAKEKLEYPIARYTMEAKRLCDVLDQHLEGRQFLVGDSLTIADIAQWPWISCLSEFYKGQEPLGLDSYTHLNAWFNRLAELPSFKVGRTINKPFPQDGFRNVIEYHKDSDGNVQATYVDEASS